MIFGNGYAVLMLLIIGFMAGFVVAAAVFLGHGRTRTTGDARTGLVMDRRAARGRRCTEVAARWCPLHGECTCRTDGPDDTADNEYDMDNRSCPLHGHHSLHGA
jgi:hypothetical protein